MKVAPGDIDAFGRGGGVDPVVGGELVARRHPFAFGDRTLGDLVSQSVRDLGEDRRSVIEHGAPPDCRSCVAFFGTLPN